MASRQDTLAAEVLQQLVGDPNDDGMPVLLARRYDPQIRPNQTVNISDMGFEGLRPNLRGDKITWEPYHDFVLQIEGKTGNCRIPDTPRNRKRLERLSKPITEMVKRVVLDDETGKLKTIEEEVTTPPTYQLLEKNLAESKLVDAVAQKVLEMMRNAGVKDQEEEAPVRPGKKAAKEAAPLPQELTEPLR